MTDPDASLGLSKLSQALLYAHFSILQQFWKNETTKHMENANQIRFKS